MSKSILEALQIPTTFGGTLLVLALILAISPYLAGHDLGIFKVPKFSALARRRLVLLGPLLLAIAVLLHVPLGCSEGKKEDNPSIEKILNSKTVTDE